MITNMSLAECAKAFLEIREFLEVRRVMYLTTATQMYCKIRGIDAVEQVKPDDLRTYYNYTVRLANACVRENRKQAISSTQQQFLVAYSEFGQFSFVVRRIDEVDPHAFRSDAGDDIASTGASAGDSATASAEEEQHAATPGAGTGGRVSPVTGADI